MMPFPTFGGQECDPPVENVIFGTEPDETVSSRLADLFHEDQQMRLKPDESMTWEEVNAIDSRHRYEVPGYLQAGKVVSCDDLYHAAMRFQHGNCTEHYQLAAALAERALQSGHRCALAICCRH